MRRRFLLFGSVLLVGAALVAVGVLIGRRDKPVPSDAADAPDGTPALAGEMKGLLRPVEVATIYPPCEGRVVEIRAKPGELIEPGYEVASLHSNELEQQYRRTYSERAEAQAGVEAANSLLSRGGLSDVDKLRILTDKRVAESRADRAMHELLELDKQYNANRPNRPGYFRAVAPPLGSAGAPGAGRGRWTVLTHNQREDLVGKTLRPNEELVRVGNLEGPWHVELKIPQRNVGQVLRAFGDPVGHFVENDPNERKYLKVDLRLASHPETSYEGRLYRDEMAVEAVPNKNEPKSEPVVIAAVRFNLPGIPKDQWVPLNQLVVGLEARAKIRFSAPPKP